MDRREFLGISVAAGFVTAINLVTKGFASASSKGEWGKLKSQQIMTGKRVAFLETENHKGGFKTTYSEYSKRGNTPDFQASFDGEVFKASSRNGDELKISGFNPKYHPEDIIDKTVNEVAPVYIRAPKKCDGYTDTLTIKYGERKLHDGKVSASDETFPQRCLAGPLLHNAKGAIIALYERKGEQAAISLEGRTSNKLVLDMEPLRNHLLALAPNYALKKNSAAGRRQGR